MHCTYYLSRNCYILQVLVQLRRLTLNILVKTRNKLPGVPVAKQLPCHTAAAESRNRFLQLHHEDDKANFKHFMFHYLLFGLAANKDNIYWSLYPKRPCKFSTNFWWTGPIQWESNGRKRSVVSIGRLTAFYVVLVPLEYILSEPPHSTYIIVSFCT